MINRRILLATICTMPLAGSTEPVQPPIEMALIPLADTREFPMVRCWYRAQWPSKPAPLFCNSKIYL